MEKIVQETTFFQEFAKRMGQSAGPYDPQKLAQRKLKTLLDQEGTLPGFRCEKCKNRGHIPRLREDLTFVYRECDCMDMRRTLLRMEESGLGDVLNDYRFVNFQTPEPWQRSAKEAAASYANDPKGWFFVGGQSGSGKTHLCCAIAGQLMRSGKRLVYMPWCQDAPRLKLGRYENKAAMELLESIKTAPVLYIDDLLKTPAGPQGRQSPTNADVILAFEIINYRYLQKLPTVISTELYPEELNAIDEAMAGRIVERSGEYTLRIKRDVKKDFRMKGVLEL